MDITILEAKDGSDFAICMAIRMEVFVREQNVPLDDEMDEFDATATHYIARADGAPAATARTRILPNGTARIERVAVRKEHRSKNIGAEIMRHLIRLLRAEPATQKISITAQTQACRFYEKLGFVAQGEEFLEAGIPHYRMELSALAMH